MEKENPGRKVNEKIEDELQPNFTLGNPSFLTGNNGGERFSDTLFFPLYFYTSLHYYSFTICYMPG